MVAKHLGRHLTNEQRKRWMTPLLDIADELNLPNDPEFRPALVGYPEWVPASRSSIPPALRIPSIRKPRCLRSTHPGYLRERTTYPTE
jgi:hemoglobin